MTNLDALTRLKKETLSSVTVLFGEDVGLFAHMKETLLKQIGYHPSDLTYSYFDLSAVRYSDVAMDLESLPFFSEEKVVILDNVLDITTTRKSYLTEQELKQLEVYLEHPLETTRLIICAAGKLDGKRRLVKLLKRDALLLEASPLSEDELQKYFINLARTSGLSFEAGSFDALMRKSQYGFGQLLKNMSFLTNYKGSGSAISLKDIDEAIPKSLQDNIFDLTKLILSGKVTEGLGLVADLRLQGEDEVKLIAIILGQLRLLLQVKLLSRRGFGEPQLVAELSDYLGRSVHPYQVKVALRDGQQLPVERLKTAIKTLIKTDFEIKSGLHEKAYLFEIALLKLANQSHKS
ncbi:DNA polymerase III subunit delta [Streptococcus entericus]|uniref:DNA polymerase III subunit delta n=1 Tax=Streptococcus entericus TaxID=155680 RepID=UPI00036DB9E4|nr:DNA polymerase III subunit delta [Streptococcus entericus]